jgi:hypothetical protein
VELEGDRDEQMNPAGLSVAQKAELRQRWKQGRPVSEIGRIRGKRAGSIQGVLSSNGGFIPPVRTRSRWALTLAEPEEISRGMAMSRSIRQIAVTLVHQQNQQKQKLTATKRCKK